MRYLIINADDFGYCPEVNQAIEDVFNHGGPLSSTTLMASFPSAGDALARCKINPKIRMGLHITTVSDVPARRPLLSPAEVPSLVDDDGYFYTSLETFYSRALADEVTAEMEAQYKFMLDSGFLPTHADSHMGSLYGTSADATFIKEALEFCARHDLPFRYPRSINGIREFIPVNPLLEASHEQAVAYADALGVKLIDYMATCMGTCMAPNDLGITSYEALKNAYLGIIADLPEGVSEVIMHPSLESPPRANRWHMRGWEYRLLLDDDFRKHIEKEDVALTTYQDAPFAVQNETLYREL
jgi:predicted glycoside hydrolase/deacetylase ChbG (UPF0249 family)